MGTDLFQKLDEQQNEVLGRDLFENLNQYQTKYGDNAFSLDYMSVPSSDYDEQAKFSVMSEEERLATLRKGPIGIGEAYQRQNKLELIPFSPAGLIDAGSILMSIKRLQSDDYGDNAEQKQKDIQRFKDFAYKLEEEQLRGFTW